MIPSNELDSKKNNQEIPNNRNLKIVSPISLDLFYAFEDGENNLPIEIAADSRLIEQSKLRGNLHELFSHLFKVIRDPQITIDQAVKEKSIDESVAVDLWDNLSTFFQQDENNARLLLYLPFEVLPDMHIQSLDDNTEATKQRLSTICFDSWIRLLHETEPRANFVDGDILETGLGNPELISKAGHLTPELLARNIITPRDVIQLMELIPHRELLQSLVEGTIVAHERGLIVDSDWDKINEIIKKKIGSPHHISQREAYLNDPHSDKISPERAKWLKKVQAEAQINLEADQISQQIINNLGITDFTPHIESGKVTALAVINAGKQIFQTNYPMSTEFLIEAEQLIKSLYELNDIGIQDVIMNGLNQWAKLGLVDDQFLQKFGVTSIDLSSPSRQVDTQLTTDFENLSIAAEKIKGHPLLSQSLYPTFLLFGSRLKGYAESNADLDAALFFKPEVQFADREQILQVLSEDVPELAQIEKFLEYWTELENGKIKFKMPQADSRTFVGEEQIHFFLNGAWLDYGDEIIQMKNDVLTRYLDLSRFGEKKAEMRKQLLGQLELDVLQYRLMHKGYRKLYPLLPRQSTKNADLIDWKSDFWDPGYRRVATKLFLSRVFLPDLS